MERDQEIMIRQNQETTYMIQKDISTIEDLEKEQYFNLERIKDAAINIDTTKIFLQDLEASKYNIRQTIEFLMVERNKLIDRVTELS